MLLLLHILGLPGPKSDLSLPCLPPNVKEHGSKLSGPKNPFQWMVVKEVVPLGTMAITLSKEISAQIISPSMLCPLFISLI